MFNKNKFLYAIISVVSAISIIFAGIGGIIPVMALDSANSSDNWTTSNSNVEITGNIDEGYDFSLPAGGYARLNEKIDFYTGFSFKYTPYSGWLMLKFNSTNDSHLGLSNSTTTYLLKASGVNVSNGDYIGTLNIHLYNNGDINVGKITDFDFSKEHTYSYSANIVNNAVVYKLRIDNYIVPNSWGLGSSTIKTLNNNFDGGYITIGSSFATQISDFKSNNLWTLSAQSTANGSLEDGYSINLKGSSWVRFAGYNKKIDLTEGIRFQFEPTGGYIQLTFSSERLTPFGLSASYKTGYFLNAQNIDSVTGIGTLKISRYYSGETPTEISIHTIQSFDFNKQHVFKMKADPNNSEKYYFSVDDQICWGNEKYITSSEMAALNNNGEGGFVSLSSDRSNATFTEFDIDVNGKILKNMTENSNEDGTREFTALEKEATVVFNKKLNFNENNSGYIFEGTDQSIPENALELSIKTKNDLKNLISIGAVGSQPSMQLFLRDKKTGDDISTTFSACYYDDNTENGTFDFEYKYGNKIFVWMRYCEDVNRWSFAVEQSNGNYIVYNTDLYAYTENATDYLSPKKLKLTLSNKDSKVIAEVRELLQIPSERRKEKFNIMNSVESNGVISLSHDNSSVYTFNEYLTFKNTYDTYVGTGNVIQENLLYLTLQPDSLPNNSYLGIRLLSEDDMESAKLAKYTLRIKIESNNGDGTGKISVSLYYDDEASERGNKIIDYKWGDQIYIAPKYNTDINRWSVAIPNVSGISYNISSHTHWHSDDPGINPGKPQVPYRFSIISYDGVKNTTAKIIKSSEVIRNEEPAIPDDVGFIGEGFTESKDENGFYSINVGPTKWAKSTWTTDLTKGLIFKIEKLGDWVSLRLSGDYFAMPSSNLGGDLDPHVTMLLKNSGGKLYVSLYTNGTEKVGKKLSGVSATGTHILSVKKHYNSANGAYYTFTIDGYDILPGHSVFENAFNKLNRYNKETGTYEGAYFRFGTYNHTTEINSLRTFECGEEKEINGWLTNTAASAEDKGDENYSLDMSSYSSIKLPKMVDLKKGVSFRVEEAEKFSNFGLAFSMLKNGCSFDIPPVISDKVGIYFTFSDNGDGTVTVLCSDGSTAKVTMNLNESHTYSFKEIEKENDELEYIFAIDDNAIYTSGIKFERFVQLNNGSIGAFPTLFSRSLIKISDFTGEFTTPSVSNGDENLWEDDWNDDEFWDDELSDDLTGDDWFEDDGSEDDWSEDDWSEDDWSEDINETKPQKYRKVLKRIKIERDPIIVEYSIWWLWVIIAVVVVAGTTFTVFLIRKKKIGKKDIK